MQSAILYINTNLADITTFGSFGYIHNNEDKKAKWVQGKFLVTNKGYMSKAEAHKYAGQMVDPESYLFGYGSDTVTTKPYSSLIRYITSVIKRLPEGTNELNLIFKIRALKDLVDKVTSLNDNEVKDDEQLNSVDITNYLNTIKKYGIVVKTASKIFDPTFTFWFNSGVMNTLATNRVGSAKDTMLDIVEPAVYLKTLVDKHPFIDVNYILFKINETMPNRYTIASFKEDEDIGKHSNEVCFSRVFLKEEDPIVSSIKTKFKAIMGKHSVITKLDLRTVYNKNIYVLFVLYGLDILETVKTRRDTCLQFFDRTPVCYVLVPQGIAFKVFDTVNNLESILYGYKENKTDKARTFIEITDLFYTKNKKDKNILKPEFNVGATHVTYTHSVNGKSVPIHIQFGVDVLGRNQLKRLEKLEPKITLVIVKYGDLHIAYHTIVDLEKSTGEGAIFSSRSSNQIFIKAIK